MPYTLISLSLAKSEIDFRHILPLLVLGNPFTAAALFNDATGPTHSLTNRIKSCLITDSFFFASLIIIIRKVNKKRNQFKIFTYYFS